MTTFSADYIFDENGLVISGPLVVDNGRDDIVDLKGRMILPGFINAHSHAFQRALRGHVEKRSSRENDSFWTWRDAMYSLVNNLSLDDIEEIALWAYKEMVATGFVAVGEFHYVHHRLDGAPFDDAAAIPKRLARAAQKAGIHLVLLLSAYERAGKARELRADQARFNTKDANAFVEFSRKVRKALPEVSHGVAIHSVRAVSEQSVRAIAKYARDESLSLHIHACEQRREIEECHEEYGVSPVAFFDRAGALFDRTTLVHATHIDQNDIELIANSNAQVCLCPSTERNLGDGLCPIRDLKNAGVSISIGSDQHARIDAFDELRSLEDHERLRLEERNVLQGKGEWLSQALMPIASTMGRRSLSLNEGSIIEHGDFIAVKTPRTYRIDASEGDDRRTKDAQVALDALLVGGAPEKVSDVFRKGVRVYSRQ